MSENGSHRAPLFPRTENIILPSREFRDSLTNSTPGEESELDDALESDETPTVNGIPMSWENYQKYYVWACCGTVTEITEHVQIVFRFEPPVSERYIGTVLNGDNAAEQLTFLEVYLPGETQLMQRATARKTLYEIGDYDPDVYAGRQELEVPQLNHNHANYPRPPLPANAPPVWTRGDDTMLLTFAGTRPEKLMSDHAHFFHTRMTSEFLAIRMAQCLHLNLSWRDAQDALKRRRLLWWAI
jgi:hypothetical protein